MERVASRLVEIALHLVFQLRRLADRLLTRKDRVRVLGVSDDARRAVCIPPGVLRKQERGTVSEVR